MGEIIALVDGSTYSESVCDHAGWAASRLGVPVSVAHILGHRQGVKADLSGNIGLGARTALLEELAELDQAKAKLAQRRGRAILEDAKARIEALGVEEVHARLRNGDLVETLQDLEANAALVMIGKRGEAADFAKLHLGSNLERVVRASDKPVMVCSRAFQPINRVLIAFDGDPATMKAIDYIADSPLFAGLSLHLLTVATASTEMRRKHEGAVALLRGKGFEVTSEIVPGDAIQVISDKVSNGEADLLVMGAYRHSRMRALIIGSTTTEMIRSCQIPLLLFR
ncbi:universal stress protein [Fluviibacterium sp. DFM31]|uniref:Universal stress protein n=1 Tax=Meridianimarinicoccus marinus TaxID=3231483 RepID=A0ABV3L2Y2_9RHOB